MRRRGSEVHMLPCPTISSKIVANVAPHIDAFEPLMVSKNCLSRTATSNQSISKPWTKRIPHIKYSTKTDTVTITNAGKVFEEHGNWFVEAKLLT